MGRRKGTVKPRSNSIQFSFYYRGERIRATLPLSPNKTNIHIAENMMSAIQHDIAFNKFNLANYFPNHPLIKRYQTASEIKISEQLRNWLKNQNDSKTLSTIRSYSSIIDYHLIPVFGDFMMNELTTTHIRNWLNTLDTTNQTKNNILIPLRGIFEDAFADEVIDRNPLDRIKHLPRRTPEPDPFSRKEIELILAACDGQIRNIFRFAFWTGLRTSELIALQWSDINFTQHNIFIRHTRTRTGDKDLPKTDSSIRKIELLPPALESLINQKQYTYNLNTDVFHNPQTNLPWKHDGPLRKTAWKPALIAAGVPYRKPYSTRHTYASMMLSNGVNPMLVAKQMGHKDWGMLRKVYGRWLPDTETTISDKISFLWAQNGHKG